MKRTRYSLLTVFLLIVLINQGLPAHANKVGTKCAKSGITTGTGNKKLTCAKKGKRLVWTSTPTSNLGSVSSPIRMGTSFRIGNIEYLISRVNGSADQMICKANSFNKGCSLDSNLNSIVDPSSTTTWVTVQISAKNLGSEIVQPGGVNKTFFLVLANGQLLERELFATFPQNFYDVQIIPGGTGIGEVAFALPKSGAPLSSLMVLRDTTNYLKASDYYFQVNW